MTQQETERLTRDAYAAFYEVTTRWMDNDVYGHVNNVHYYSYFDTVVNSHLIEHGGLNPATSSIIGVIVESGCRYFSPVEFPSKLAGGLRVEHLSQRSVRYGIGIFQESASSPSAQGYFVHVFVDRATFKPVPIPDDLRRALEMLKVKE